MVQLTDNFIIEVPTMQVEVFLTYLKSKLPMVKNYYYIQEIKKAERISPIQIMDGINGYYTYSRFVAKLTFEGVYLPPCSCVKITSKNYDLNTKILKLSSSLEIPNMTYIPKQGKTSSHALIDLSNDNLRLIQTDLDDLQLIDIPQNILSQLSLENLQTLTKSKSSDINEVMEAYIKKQPLY